MEACGRQVNATVRKWILKDPAMELPPRGRDIPKSAKMHGNTHSAIQRHGGGPFRSQGLGKFTYTWIQNL